ncbi:MAG: aminopeptidase [Bacilli bacterium]|nr:aminopeptidase [Bacilli bacterium]
MEALMRKYATVLLESCLKLEKEQPLFISFNIERIDFARVVAEVAFEMGIKDLYFDSSDPYLKHEALKNLEIDELKDLSFWNKEMWNVYAKKKAAFLMLASEMPGLMKDIDPEKIKEMTKYSYKTRKTFDKMRDKSELSWCIAAVPTTGWAKAIFPDSKDPVTDLWNLIFDICHMREEDPTKTWNEKMKRLTTRSNKLTNYQFKKLIYQSSNGTNFSVELPKNHIWASGKSWINNKKEVLVNFPTEEVFTSPDKNTANGIVYASKPLAYQEVLIKDFWITFKDGKVVNFDAKEGKETLEKMIHLCENSNYLGEVALVPFHSAISNTNKVFLETLFDENASCHIALGDSFPECIEKGEKQSKKKLQRDYGLNKCDSHVDFMIGTKDLSVTGITEEGKGIPIIENGDFTKEFE